MAGLDVAPWSMAPRGEAAQLATRLHRLVPRLETRRLVLCAPALPDFDPYAAILTSDRARFMAGPFEREAAWLDFAQYTAGWLLRGAGLWGFRLRDGGAVLGFITIGMECGDREHELGYFLTPEAEGHGFATEAAATARDFALKTHGLPSLVSYIDPENTRAARVAHRLGAWRDTKAEADFATPVHVYRHGVGCHG